MLSCSLLWACRLLSCFFHWLFWLVLCCVLIGFSWQTNVSFCLCPRLPGCAYQQRCTLLSLHQWQRVDLLFSVGKRLVSKTNFNSGLNHFSKTPMMLQFHNSWSLKSGVILCDSIWNADQFCNSHVTFWCIHAVVQGLDGHPANRQPSLKAKQKINQVLLMFMYHVENEIEDSISCLAIVNISVCAMLTLYECKNPCILNNYCPLVGETEKAEKMKKLSKLTIVFFT